MGVPFLHGMIGNRLWDLAAGVISQITTRSMEALLVATFAITLVEKAGARENNQPAVQTQILTYGATKAALRSFVRTWTAELAGKGIRTNMLSPGPTETPILTGQFGENTDAMRERFKTMIPMGRMGKPEDIAAAALFLASDESRFITGIDLSVDGGLVAV